MVGGAVTLFWNCTSISVSKHEQRKRSA